MEPFCRKAPRPILLPQVGVKGSMYRSPKEMQSFDVDVWQAVAEVPASMVVTYGQVAKIVGPPAGVDEDTYRAFGARWVGQAMARCPDSVPWHRVVNSQGKISLRGESGAHLQREKLEAEGVEFDARGKIDLKRFQWQPGQADS
jgi:methylated-DNA-protein-cysteine methyltransferase related protein